MNDVYDFIDFRNQIHSPYENLHRIDRRDYPEAALREALLNLLVHREYAFGASALISIYSDRIEFVSIGGLVSGITLNDITMGISICRNAKLANIFYRLELIEAYGTGIQKIMNSYSGAERMPQIEVSDNAFKIVLPNRNANEKREGTERDESGKKEAGYKKERKNINEEKVLTFVKERGAITRKELEKLLNISQTTCGWLLRQMVEHGLIIQEGKGKNTWYCLAE